MPLHFSIFLKP
ncbi:hypothetical protein BpHYR1_011304 [Brachionus plicatilis]|uniref:Uncharacterized protein n=1 Tax=Brachionus plicatilis TaxID=10195 RepID=A0A3M7S0Y9_BRAPC|nr:hypothetical protein BpHYR1_011304 [Brachionus plicatilis]